MNPPRMTASARVADTGIGPDGAPAGSRRSLPLVAVRELVATVRTALGPVVGRLHPLPPANERSAYGPVMLVHGFLGHPEQFRPLRRRLRHAGFGRVVCLGYPSTRLPLDRIVDRLDRLADSIGEPVDLVGHSLGAVVCRAWLKRFGGALRARRFVSLGGPHGGTALWWLAPPVLHDVLDPEGPWVGRLSRGPEPVPTTVIRAAYDHQVLPPVRATLPGAREIVIPGHGHNGLLWSPAAHRAVIEALS